MHRPIATPDFDILQALYQCNPLAFEALRQQILNDFVAAAPIRHQPALQKTLDRLEIARQEAKTPIDAAMVASRMMHESWTQLEDSWSHLRHEVAALETFVVLDRIKKRGRKLS